VGSTAHFAAVSNTATSATAPARACLREVKDAAARCSSDGRLRQCEDAPSTSSVNATANAVSSPTTPTAHVRTPLPFHRRHAAWSDAMQSITRP